MLWCTADRGGWRTSPVNRNERSQPPPVLVSTSQRGRWRRLRHASLATASSPSASLLAPAAAAAASAATDSAIHRVFVVTTASGHGTWHCWNDPCRERHLIRQLATTEESRQRQRSTAGLCPSCCWCLLFTTEFRQTVLKYMFSKQGCICQIFTGGSEFRLATSDYSGHGGCQIGTVE